LKVKKTLQGKGKRKAFFMKKLLQSTELAEEKNGGDVTG
jgi:hypothetical protein